MNTIIKQADPEEVRKLLERMKVINRMPKDIRDRFLQNGWTIDDYSIEKIHKGYYIVIEFCIGDFCVSICSKKRHWLLEPKISHDNFLKALAEAQRYEMRIDRGEHWTGEDS